MALPSNFQNILSVCRSQEYSSCDIILQNIAQIKKLFKDDWEGLLRKLRYYAVFGWE